MVVGDGTRVVVVDDGIVVEDGIVDVVVDDGIVVVGIVDEPEKR